MKRVYFAHSMQIYGTRESRAAEIRVMRAFPGCRVLNPETLDWDAMTTRYGEGGAYWHVVRLCDVIVVLERRGHVGKGVFEEVRAARAQNKPVFVLRGTRLLPVGDAIRTAKGDWKERYGKLVLSNKTAPALL